jgi:allantoin racemase
MTPEMEGIPVKGTIVYWTPPSGYSLEERERREAIVRRYVPDDFTLTTVAMRDAPPFLEKREDYEQAVKIATRELAALDLTGVDALVLAGAIDPALAQLRALASVPVIGPGEAAMYLGSILRKPLSIVTVDGPAAQQAEHFLAVTAVKPTIASIRHIDTPIRVIVGNIDAAVEAVRRECRAAVEHDGAGTLYLGAMTLATLGISEQLRREIGVPVLDPARVAIRTAVECVRARRES